MTDKVAFNLVEEEGNFKLMQGDEEVASSSKKEDLIEQLDDEFEGEYEIVDPIPVPKKDEKKDDEPVEREPVPEVTPEPTPEKEPEPEPQVPVAALTDERNKRQAYEAVVKQEMDALKAKIATLETPSTPAEPVDPYGGLDPDETVSVRDFAKAMGTLSDNFNTQMETLQGCQQADVLMEQLKHNPDIPGLGMSTKDIIETAAPILNSNPQVKAQLGKVPNPLYELYMVANSQRMQSAFGIEGTPTNLPYTPPVVEPTPESNAKVTEAVAARTTQALASQQNLPPSQDTEGDAIGTLGSPVDAAMVRLAQFAGDREAYHAELIRLKKDEPAIYAAIETAMDEAEE